MDILNKKINEKTMVLFFSATLVLVVIQFLYSFMVTSNQLSKVEEMVSNKGVVVITETADMQKRKIYENDTDIALMVANQTLKNMFGFDYKTIDKNLNYVKAFTDVKTYNKYYKTILKNLKEAQILKDNYKIYINKYKITKEGKDFIVKMVFERKSFTETKEESNKFYIVMKINKSTPTEINQIGFYITDYKIKIYDAETVDKEFL